MQKIKFKNILFKIKILHFNIQTVSYLNVSLININFFTIFLNGTMNNQLNLCIDVCVIDEPLYGLCLRH